MRKRRNQRDRDGHREECEEDRRAPAREGYRHWHFHASGKQGDQHYHFGENFEKSRLFEWIEMEQAKDGWADQ